MINKYIIIYLIGVVIAYVIQKRIDNNNNVYQTWLAIIMRLLKSSLSYAWLFLLLIVDGIPAIIYKTSSWKIRLPKPPDWL